MSRLEGYRALGGLSGALARQADELYEAMGPEERRAVREYKREASKKGFGTFGDLLKAKLKKN